MTHPSVPTYKWSDGLPGDLKYDAIRRAVLLARKAEYQVTGMVLHPDEVADIELAKGDDGHYMFVVINESQGRRLWRIPYVETTAINPGEGLVGAFRQGATLFDRAMASVRVSEHHNDFFMRNMVQVLIEQRIAFEITRPQAFVAIEFDEAPEAPGGDD
jgi:HK97 family phage major capsid protein